MLYGCMHGYGERYNTAVRWTVCSDFVPVLEVAASVVNCCN